MIEGLSPERDLDPPRFIPGVIIRTAPISTQLTRWRPSSKRARREPGASEPRCTGAPEASIRSCRNRPSKLKCLLVLRAIRLPKLAIALGLQTIEPWTKIVQTPRPAWLCASFSLLGQLAGVA